MTDLPPGMIEVEGDKPKVERTRKHFAKQTEEQRRDEKLHELFGSRIRLSVQVMRPAEKYPYERTVWASEINVPVDEETDVQAVVTAWIATMDSGIALAASRASVDACRLLRIPASFTRESPSTTARSRWSARRRGSGSMPPSSPSAPCLASMLTSDVIRAHAGT